MPLTNPNETVHIVVALIRTKSGDPEKPEIWDHNKWVKTLQTPTLPGIQLFIPAIQSVTSDGAAYHWVAFTVQDTTKAETLLTELERGDTFYNPKSIGSSGKHPIPKQNLNTTDLEALKTELALTIQPITVSSSENLLNTLNTIFTIIINRVNQNP